MKAASNHPEFETRDTVSQEICVVLKAAASARRSVILNSSTQGKIHGIR
jgi:hypothetical protein